MSWGALPEATLITDRMGVLLPADSQAASFAVMRDGCLEAAPLTRLPAETREA